MWKGSLRMYGGTLTVESANDNIVKVVYAVSFNNWDESNNVNNQELKMTSEKEGTRFLSSTLDWSLKESSSQCKKGFS